MTYPNDHASLYVRLGASNRNSPARVACLGATALCAVVALLGLSWLSQPPSHHSSVPILPTDEAKAAPAARVVRTDEAKAALAARVVRTDDAKSAPADRVVSLPGAPPLEDVHYAGHVTVDASAGNKLFYWFIESSRVGHGKEAPHDVPLVIWLNGGPGASSLTGLLVEGIGPLLLQPDGETLEPMESSWHHLAHVIAWEQPVGTGFATTATGSYVTDMTQMATQLLEGMRQFYLLHPEYRTSPVFVTGESFAGKYIPHFCAHVHGLNKRAAALGEEWPLPLAGLAVGNGVLKPLLQFGLIPQVAEALGYTDAATRAAAASSLATCKQRLRAIAEAPAAARTPAAWKFAYDPCQNVESNIYGDAVPFVYDVREPTDKFGAVTDYMTKYLNQPEVRAALHVGETVWQQADGGQPGNLVSDNLWRDQIDDLPEGMLGLLFDHYRVLFYAGQYDGSMCNQLGVSRTIDTVRWAGSATYANSSVCTWKVGGVPAGVLRAAGRFGFLVVLNSGHLVPMNQPVHASEMIRYLIAPTKPSFEGMCG